MKFKITLKLNPPPASILKNCSATSLVFNARKVLYDVYFVFHYTQFYAKL